MNASAYYPRQKVQVGGIFDMLIPSKRKKAEESAKEKAEYRIGKMQDAAERIEAAKQDVLDATQAQQAAAAAGSGTETYLVMAGIGVGAVILGILFFGRKKP